MINIAALALLLSTLAAAGVWSPAPNPPAAADPHLVREGHRVIVVEYERHVPLESQPHPSSIKEATNLLPNVGQGVSTPESAADVAEKPASSAREQICDAYGSCKEKISNVLHRGKDKISRKASDIKDNAEAAVERGKEKASETASHFKENAKNAVESTMNKASALGEAAKGSVKEKMDGTKDVVRTAVEGAKDAVKSAVEVSRDAETDIVGNISKAVDRAEEAASSIRRNLTDIASRAKDVAIDAAKYVGAPEMARAAASVAHLFAFATAYGTCVWVTFVSSHVLAAAVPRQQFGMAQSKLYPVYFRAVAYAIGIACLGHFFAKKNVVGVERVQGYNLLAALGLVLFNMFYLEPKATKVMFERMKMEKEEGRGRHMADVLGEQVNVTATTASTTQSASTIGVTRTTIAMDQDVVKGRAVKLNKKLKKLNKYSSLLNVLTLMSLTWHLVYLSRRLQMTC